MHTPSERHSACTCRMPPAAPHAPPPCRAQGTCICPPACEGTGVTACAGAQQGGPSTCRRATERQSSAPQRCPLVRRHGPCAWERVALAPSSAQLQPGGRCIDLACLFSGRDQRRSRCHVHSTHTSISAYLHEAFGLAAGAGWRPLLASLASCSWYQEQSPKESRKDLHSALLLGTCSCRDEQDLLCQERIRTRCKGMPTCMLWAHTLNKAKVPVSAAVPGPGGVRHKSTIRLSKVRYGSGRVQLPRALMQGRKMHHPSGHLFLLLAGRQTM